MAQDVQIIDLRRSYVPIDPNEFPITELDTEREDSPEPRTPAIPYDGYNFMPTEEGYSSFFGINSTVNIATLVTSGGSGNVDDLFIIQTDTFHNVIIALCDDGIWSKDGTAAGNWTHVIVLAPPGAGLHLQWTKVVLENEVFVYRQGAANIYRANSAGAWVFIGYVPSFLTMAAQVGIFKAGGRLGAWDSLNSTSWSVLGDPTLFDPSTETLAGNTIFADIVGRIVNVLQHGNGFIIYCTKSVVHVRLDPTSPMLFRGNSIFNNNGISYPEEVCFGEPDTNHFAMTTDGLVEITGLESQYNSLDVKFSSPEVSTYLKSARQPVMLKVLGGRYLCFQFLDSRYISGRGDFITVDGVDYYNTPIWDSVTYAGDVVETFNSGATAMTSISSDASIAESVYDDTTFIARNLASTSTYRINIDTGSFTVGVMAPSQFGSGSIDEDGDLFGETLNTKISYVQPDNIIKFFNDGSAALGTPVQIPYHNAQDGLLVSISGNINIRYSLINYPAHTATKTALSAMGMFAGQFCNIWPNSIVIARGSFAGNTIGIDSITGFTALATVPVAIAGAGTMLVDIRGSVYVLGADKKIYRYDVPSPHTGITFVLGAVSPVALTPSPTTPGLACITDQGPGGIAWRKSFAGTGPGEVAAAFNIFVDENPFKAGYVWAWELLATSTRWWKIRCSDLVVVATGTIPQLAGVGRWKPALGGRFSDQTSPVWFNISAGNILHIGKLPASLNPYISPKSLILSVPTINFQVGSIAPIYPTFLGAFVLDLQYKKWGKIKQSFKRLLDFFPINNIAGDASIPYDTFLPRAAALLTTGSIAIFDQYPSDSRLVYGKIGLYRKGFTDIQELRAKHRLPLVGSISLEMSLDGSNVDPSLTITKAFTGGRDWVAGYSSSAGEQSSARWYNVIITGNYDLIALEFRGKRAGRR